VEEHIKINFHLTENTLCLNYKDRSVHSEARNAFVYGLNRTKKSDILSVQNTEMINCKASGT
jgi:hypothetical protein